MKSNYTPSSHVPNIDAMSDFKKTGHYIADLIASDERLNDESHTYAKRKCAGLSVEVDQDTIDDNEIYWTFVQEYTTNAIIVALELSRTYITGANAQG